MTLAARTTIAAGWRLGLFLLVAIGLTGCQGFTGFAERLMTPEQEVRFGAQIARQVEKREQLVTDPAVLKYVREVGGRIARTSPHSDVPIRFYVVKDPTINAFAIPGGNIYVNTGLLKAADDEAELASVIAHEIGHVVRRHAAIQVSHAVTRNAIQQSILGGNSTLAAQMISSLFAKGVLFNFSREDEFEADTIAVRTLYHAGYDPQALKRLFFKLVQAYGDTTPPLHLLQPLANLTSPADSIHPSTRERIARVDALIATLPTPPYTPSTTDLRRVQGRLKQLNLIE